MDPNDDIESLRGEALRYERQGRLFEAYDTIRRALERAPDDRWMQYRAVMILHRARALESAAARFNEFGMAASDDQEVQMLALRLTKDRAFAASGAAQRDLARRAADGYFRIHADKPDYYPAINAATLSLFAGDHDRARQLARTAIELAEKAKPSSDDDRYCAAASMAEALLLLGAPSRARAALQDAVEAHGADLGARATTRRQLRYICRHLDIDLDVLAPLAVRPVVHYCGHMVAPPGTAGRFSADMVPAARQAIVDAVADIDPGYAYGSLASGADILIAEAVLDRGGELHLILPFKEDEFRAISVAPAGADWQQRYSRCRNAAVDTHFATDDEYLGDDALFALATRFAMGLAFLRARDLDVAPVQIALWDQIDGEGVAGTAADIKAWSGYGYAQRIVPIGGRPPAAGAAPVKAASGSGRVNRAILFGDIKGYSGLTDRQLPVFLDTVMGSFAEVLGRYEQSIGWRNTWGDGIYVVFDDVFAAASCAMDLQTAIAETDLKKLGLPDDLALRAGLHYGPVLKRVDPVLGRAKYFGAHVSRTARIEPITPEGQVYVTAHFAAALALDSAAAFACEPVGLIPMAKGYGSLPIYLLTAATGGGYGPF